MDIPQTGKMDLSRGNILQGKKINMISCIGDIMPADTSYTLGNGIATNMAGLSRLIGNRSAERFSRSDLVICNLESPLISRRNNESLPFAGNPEIADLLKLLNISVVSIANNHMLDHGREGLDSTLRILDDNGIAYIGLRHGECSNIVYRSAGDIKIALAAFNDIHDNNDSDLIAPVSWDIMMSTLDEIRKNAPDLILFSLHWGNEYITYPSPAQSGMAHRLIDEGVDIIMGHHPHVVQPVERYRGGIIIYSLGNYIFDMLWAEKVRIGIQADVLLSDNGSPGCVVYPFRIGDDFVPDYTCQRDVSAFLSGQGALFSRLQAGSTEAYEKRYLDEVRAVRSSARFRMKIYLMKSFFSISPASRRLFFHNLKRKIQALWKKN